MMKDFFHMLLVDAIKSYPVLCSSTVGPGGPVVVGSSLAAQDEAQPAGNFLEHFAR